MTSNLPQQPPVTYKGLTFNSEAFASFVKEYFMVPAQNVAPEIKNVQVMYDEHGEISADGPKRFVIMYLVSEEKGKVIQVDTLTALKACYADGLVAEGRDADLDDDEKTCLQNMQRVRDDPMIILGY